MMTFEQAKNLKIGQELIISYEPTGKNYRGVVYPQLVKVKVRILKFEARGHDDLRPLKFELNSPVKLNMDETPRTVMWIPIEGITVHPTRESYEMPEIEPGMHAFDENGIHWLAIKQSRLEPTITWITVQSRVQYQQPDSPAFRETITSVFDVDNESGRRMILWDKKKSMKIQELSEKQKQLTAELEAVNAQLAQIK